MDIPDVSGFTLGMAKELLNKSGFEIDEIETTSPPRTKSTEYDDSFRVIRQRLVDEKRVKLLICKPL